MVEHDAWLEDDLALELAAEVRAMRVDLARTVREMEARSTSIPLVGYEDAHPDLRQPDNRQTDSAVGRVCAPDTAEAA